MPQYTDFAPCRCPVCEGKDDDVRLAVAEQIEDVVRTFDKLTADIATAAERLNPHTVTATEIETTILPLLGALTTQVGNLTQLARQREAHS